VLPLRYPVKQNSEYLKEQVLAKSLIYNVKLWSGRKDSNLRPSGPKPDCHIVYRHYRTIPFAGKLP